MVTDIPLPGHIMAAETAEIPNAVARALSKNQRQIDRLVRLLGDPAGKSIVTCARGSSDHAAGFFKYLAEIALGLPIASVGPSTASVYEAPLDFRDRILISVSQSGESPDLVAFQAQARARGALTIALVNRSNSPLAVGADETLDIAAGEELSVPATKSAVAAMTVLASLVAQWSGNTILGGGLDRLADCCAKALECDWSAPEQALTAARSAFIVGRGPALPIAMEAALKLKETAGLHAEAFSGAEVMHGPLQLVEQGFPILMFAPRDAAWDMMQSAQDKLVALGAEVFSGGRLPYPGSGCPLLDPLVMLTAFYKLAGDVARLRGHDPDHPIRLSKVTRTI